MKSTILIAREYGKSDVLEFVTQELPALAPDAVRVEVKASGINPIDARRMTGEFKQAPLPQAFGNEFAGIVREVGSAVSDWKVGDEVLGSGSGFTHATVIDVAAANLVRRPANLPWEVAGTLAGVGQTAATLLRELGDIKSLLINGGSGGVGSIAIQLARQAGIDVVATASAKNQDYLRELGATPVVYGEGVIDRIKAVHPAPFDAALDMVGSKEAMEASLALVKPDGEIGTIAGKPVISPRIKPMWTKRNRADLEKIAKGVAAGELKWEVSRSYPFAEAQKAYADILDGHTRGKSVLIF